MKGIFLRLKSVVKMEVREAGSPAGRGYMDDGPLDPLSELA